MELAASELLRQLFLRGARDITFFATADSLAVPAKLALNVIAPEASRMALPAGLASRLLDR